MNGLETEWPCSEAIPYLLTLLASSHEELAPYHLLRDVLVASRSQGEVDSRCVMVIARQSLDDEACDLSR